MTFTEIKRNMQLRYGADFLTVTQICEYLGLKNHARVKEKYLAGLDRVDKKYYFVDDVARSILSKREDI